jgi:hypothetical protein
VDGRLVPNTELGHMEIRGRDAERRSAAAARVRRGISWKAWAEDLDEHLNAIHRLFWPTLLILGGGVSKNADRFVPRLTVPTPIVAATLRNEAGIVGAALFAAESVGMVPVAIPEAEPEEGSEAAAAQGAAEAETAQPGAVGDAAAATAETEAALEAEAQAAAEAEAAAEPEADEEAVATAEHEATAEAEAARGDETTVDEEDEEALNVPSGSDPTRGAAGPGPTGTYAGIEPSVTVAPAWAADAPEGDAQGYPIAPATMASSGPRDAVEENAAGEPSGDGAEDGPGEAEDGPGEAEDGPGEAEDGPGEAGGGDAARAGGEATEPLEASEPLDPAGADDRGEDSDAPGDVGMTAQPSDT